MDNSRLLFQSRDASYVQAVAAEGAWIDRSGTEYEVTSVYEVADVFIPRLRQWAVRGIRKPTDRGSVVPA
jgi:hypothetical protein